MHISFQFIRNFTIVLIVFSSQFAFSQAPAKWSVNGNATVTGDFLGTTNNNPVIFYANNQEWMRLKADGNLKINNLAGLGNGFVTANNNGVLGNTPFTNDTNQVLTGAGTFRSISSFGGMWQQSGNNIFLPSGKVGIGTNSPNYKLDVNGNARVTGTLHASGLVLASRMEADTIKGTSMVVVNNNLNISAGILNEVFVNTGDLRLQSKVGYNGNTVLNAGTSGNVGIGVYNPVAKLDVNGNVRVNGTMNFSALATGHPIQVCIDAAGNLVPILGPSTNSCNSTSVIDWNTRGNNGIDENLDFLGTCDEAALIFKTFNSERMRISSNGDVGIGTSIPSGRFDVRLNSIDPIGTPAAFFSKASGQNIRSIWVVPELDLSSYSPISQQGDFGIFWSDGALPDGKNYNSSFVIAPWSNTLNGLRITSSGDIGIGLSNPQYKLDVCGTIRAKEVRVNTTGCDFVFESRYNLMSIDSLSNYIGLHQHLPNIPSAREMETNDGVELGKLNSLYLQKIEELTLYVIQLNNRIAELEKTKE